MDNKAANFIDSLKTNCKKVLYIVGMFSFFINMLMLILPIYMLQVFDRVLASFSGETLLYLTLIASFLLLIFGILNAVRSHLLVHLSSWLDNTVGPVALERSMDEILHNNPYAQQSLEDLAVIRQFVSGPAITTAFDAPWVPLFLLIIYFLNIWLGVLATIGAISLFICGLINERLSSRHIRESKIHAMKAQQQYYVMANNAETIQSMGMLSKLGVGWSKARLASLNHQDIASKRSGEMLAVSKFLRLLLQIFMLAGGAYLVILNKFTPGMMIAGTILLARALAPVEQTIGTWRQVVQAREAYQRLKQYLLLTPPRIEVAGLPSPKGRLAVKEVTFQLPNIKKPILYNINFHTMPGEMLAIAGASASGKSTLARLLIGALPPSHGAVRLDGADIFQWSRDEVGEHIGYLAQTPELFVGTARENIARMEQNVDEAVMATTALAGIHELILSLPEGYDTMIAPSGRNLSGGQRQQIALARALFKSPQLIVLDEPSTYLDTESKKTLLKTLIDLREQGKTLVVVTHELDIMQKADRLLFLREGRTFLYGPTEKVFAKLQELQQPSTPPNR